MTTTKTTTQVQIPSIDGGDVIAIINSILHIAEETSSLVGSVPSLQRYLDYDATYETARSRSQKAPSTMLKLKNLLYHSRYGPSYAKYSPSL